MTTKDFSKLVTKNLDLKVGDKVYSVEPPTREDGKIMMAINLAGVQAFSALSGVCDVCGRGGDTEMDPSMKALVDANNDRDLGELSLRNAYAQICEDQDAAMVERLELYAFYYWSIGEKFADQWLQEYEQTKGFDLEDLVTPKGQKPSKSGRNTASAKSSTTRRKGTRSTPTTASRKK